MDLFTAQQSIQDDLNELRRLHTLIVSKGFTEIFDESEDKDIVLDMIVRHEISSIEQWMRDQRRKLLQFMSAADLRQECRFEGVKNYHLMGRDEMIERLKLTRSTNVIK
jgi:hypothetical protein